MNAKPQSSQRNEIVTTFRPLQFQTDLSLSLYDENHIVGKTLENPTYQNGKVPPMECQKTKPPMGGPNDKAIKRNPLKPHGPSKTL